MILKPIKDLAELENKLLRSYTVGGGSPTGGCSLSIYIRDFPDIHPNDLRNALFTLVTYGYLTTKAGHGEDSFFFTDDGVFEANKHFKKEVSKKIPNPTDIDMKKTLDYPNKITLAWLWHNVPYSFWVWFASSL